VLCALGYAEQEELIGVRYNCRLREVAEFGAPAIAVMAGGQSPYLVRLPSLLALQTDQLAVALNTIFLQVEATSDSPAKMQLREH